MNKIRNLTNNYKFLFFILSVVWAVILAFAIMICDDTGAMRVEGGNIASYWAKSMDHYHNWASRVLVNFVIFLFTDRMPVYWAVYMGVSMYVLLSACSYLLIDSSKKEECYLLISFIMLFPYWHINTAGWMSTMGTYFAPMAFGMMSLVPVKKITRNDKINLWEYPWYILCLIYGANNEQMMVLLLGCYGIANIFWWINKRFSVFGMIQLLISAASALFVATCPGNAVRRRIEIMDRFPAFDHLNLLGKAELGYETGIYELIYDQNIFFIMMCIVLLVLVWNKYEDKIIRILSVIPATITLAFGPLKNVVATVFPYANGVCEPIPYWGLVNEGNRGGLGYFTQFFVLSVCLIIILMDLYLLCENWTQFIVVLTMLGFGIASRIAIGFSPTIYISGIRTNTVMYYSFIFVTCYIFSIQLRTNNISKKRVIPILLNITYSAGFLATLNFIFVVANSFRE